MVKKNQKVVEPIVDEVVDIQVTQLATPQEELRPDHYNERTVTVYIGDRAFKKFYRLDGTTYLELL